jgi:hypothetical protein
MRTLSNWGRWGADDELGTINLITPEKRAAAARLVKDGVSVTCARPWSTEITAETTVQGMRFMVDSGEGRDHDSNERILQRRGAAEFIGMVFHGYAITHVDAPPHYFWQGQFYNGRSSNLVTSREGATVNSVEVLRDGVVTRGVLLDVARAKNVKWMGPGDGVMPEDLEAAEKVQGVRVDAGDILLVRTARRPSTWPAARGSASAGWPWSAPTRTTTSRRCRIPPSATPSTWSHWWPWGCGSSTTRTSRTWRARRPHARAGSSCSPSPRSASRT